MDGNRLDRLARALSQSTSRRHTLAALTAVVLARPQVTHAATQIQLPACAESGSVCTLMSGCCSGLVCATSYMNPAYGVCVAGEGGMLPVSDSIVTPASEGIETELAQAVTEAVAASDAAVAAEATEDSERQARIDTRRANKDTRRSTQRTNKQSRGDTRQTNKRSRRTTERTNAAPQIGLEFFLEVPPAVPADVELLDGPPTEPLDAQPEAEAPKGQPEIVRIRNFDDVSVVLSRVESMNQPQVFSTSSITIPAGGTYMLESGKYVPTSAPANTTIWTKENVCPGGGGVTLTAAQSGSTLTHQFSVLCGATASFVSTETVDTQKRKNAKEQQQKQQQRRRKLHQKRQDRQQAKRQKGGKGR